jgi:hypothetical protein
MLGETYNVNTRPQAEAGMAPTLIFGRRASRFTELPTNPIETLIKSSCHIQAGKLDAKGFV